jgi:hypothetical protein
MSVALLNDFIRQHAWWNHQINLFRGLQIDDPPARQPRLLF